MNIARFSCLLCLVAPSILAITHLPPIVITASAPSSAFDTLSAVSSLTAKQLNSTSSPLLADALNAQAGIQVVDPGGSGRTAFSLRGFGVGAATNTLILLNGQPYLNPDLGTWLADSLPVAELERVEIMPGSSVLYGDQAVGGVINFVTKAPSAKTGQLLLNYGSFATRQAQLIASDYVTNTFGYRIHATTLATNHYRHHNTEHSNNFLINLVYKTINLHYTKTNQHLELPGKLTWQQAQQKPRQAEHTLSYSNQASDLVQANFTHAYTDTWQLQLNAMLSWLRGWGAYGWDGKAMDFRETKQLINLQPKLQGVLNWRQYSCLPTLGLDWNYGQTQFLATQASQQQGAAYGQVKIPLGAQFTTILGARLGMAYYDLTSSTTTTRPMNKAYVTDGELAWQPHQQWRWFIKRAGNYRFPKTDEIMFTRDGAPLKPQQGVSYETGITYTPSYGAVTLSAYRLQLHDEIFAVPVPTSKYFIYNENLSATRRTGSILDLTLMPHKQVQCTLNYNLVFASFAAGALTGNRMPWVAQHNLKLAGMFYPWPEVSLLIEGLYTGNQYPINDVDNQAAKLGGYTVYNLGLSYERPHYQLALRGNNLTNKRYYSSAVTTYQAASSTIWYYPAAGRAVLLTVTLKL